MIGTGLDRIYPAANRDLGHRLAAKAGLLSEFPLGTPPLPANFPRRNRLISGLSRGVLVVEATLASGSLITARFAAEQGREVFAIPGSIHSPFSKGSHRLIKEGAKLVETAQDVLEELRRGRRQTTRATPAAAAGPCEGDAGRVLDGARARSGRRRCADRAHRPRRRARIASRWSSWSSRGTHRAAARRRVPARALSRRRPQLADSALARLVPEAVLAIICPLV